MSTSRAFTFAGALLFASCGAPTSGGTDAPPGAADATTGGLDARAPGADAPTSPGDAAIGPDASAVDDGPPTRAPCTNTLGAALTARHGRLDGYLVAIVPPTAHGCNADANHVHLQVRMNGEVYDAAVNVSDPANVDYLAKDLPMPDAPWAEGWHPDQAGAFDYPTIGVHTADFTPVPEASLTAAIDAELATANHVSVFMTGYGPDGGHLVHRNKTGADGAIVIRPLGAPRILMFHFAGDTF
jgi:hypothetical protein